MVTYQDLLAVGNDEKKRIEFVRETINKHKSSELYKMAETAYLYDAKKNVTISQYEKTLTTVTGRIVKDNYSPNHKVISNFFDRFVCQQNQFLLGNGVTWQNEDTEKKVGKDFDSRLQYAGKNALIGGVSFGFWNLDHVEVFKVTEFAPMPDEENGSLRAGIRWWQIDANKPLRATLYEEDGYTEYIWNRKENGSLNTEGEVYREKQKYIINVRTSEVDGTQIIDGENYPTFPIVPFWGNPQHQSELVGMQEGIDAYDLIKNGFENDLDNAQIYWLIKGAGGMDDVDLARFLQRIKYTNIVNPEDGQEVEVVPIEIPYEAREKLLDRIKKDLYEDYMALDLQGIASGAATATQIRAAYEPMNTKADQYEYCVLDFIHGILAVAGIDDEPTFTRSMLVNTQEEVQTVLQAADYLGREYTTQKILTLLGDGDKEEEVLRTVEADELDRGININEDVVEDGGETEE